MNVKSGANPATEGGTAGLACLSAVALRIAPPGAGKAFAMDFHIAVCALSLMLLRFYLAGCTESRAPGPAVVLDLPGT